MKSLLTLSKLAAALLFSFSLVISGNLMAEESECSVPICDIDKKIEELAGKSQAFRWEAIINLSGTYEKTTDLAIINNLLSFGRKLREICKEDDQYIIDGANGLISRNLVKLSMYGEINGEQFLANYKDITGMGKLKEVLDYWRKEIENIDNIKVLDELMFFAVGAKAHSEEKEHKQWVIGAAKGLMRVLTSRITVLSPFQEGIYEITLDAGIEVYPFNRIVVIETANDSGLVVQFLDQDNGIPIYSFYKASFTDGKYIKGSSITQQKVIFFDFEIDRLNKSVTGKIVDSRFGFPITFSGFQSHSITKFFENTLDKPYTEEQVIGTYEGRFANKEGVLSIFSYAPHKYYATFKSHDKTIVKNFLGKLFSEKGVFSFIHSSQGNTIKLVLASGENNIWNGTMFSTRNAVMNSVSFTKTK